ncbi:hypothetical protein AVEN_121119-1 [Araneus ventricosus]|uniref:Secreted protein n=1 Tax=Araneus ventricosus TaxID=182803 RepID=A0A4Y2KU48_ARAVE|nr:hypothetical protein AVEN_121119-1 [Araneus ventricosus]
MLTMVAEAIFPCLLLYCHSVTTSLLSSWKKSRQTSSLSHSAPFIPSTYVMTHISSSSNPLEVKQGRLSDFFHLVEFSCGDSLISAMRDTGHNFRKSLQIIVT